MKILFTLACEHRNMLKCYIEITLIKFFKNGEGPDEKCQVY